MHVAREARSSPSRCLLSFLFAFFLFVKAAFKYRSSQRAAGRELAIHAFTVYARCAVGYVWPSVRESSVMGVKWEL